MMYLKLNSSRKPPGWDIWLTDGVNADRYFPHAGSHAIVRSYLSILRGLGKKKFDFLDFNIKIKYHLKL